MAIWCQLTTRGSTRWVCDDGRKRIRVTRRVSPDSSYPGSHRPRALKSYFAAVADAIAGSTMPSVLNFRKKQGLASGRVSLSSRLLDLAQSRLAVLLSPGIGAVLFHLSLYSLA